MQEVIRSPELVGDGHIVREGVPRGYLPLDMRELGPADDGGGGGSAGRSGAAGRVAPASGSGAGGNGTGSSSGIQGSTSGRVGIKKKKKKKQQGGSGAASKRGSNDNPILRAIAEEKRGRGKEDQEGF